MSRGSVSIDVRGGMSIDVGWVWAVDGRVVSVDGKASVGRQTGPQLLLVSPQKVSIDSNNGVSIDTPFSPSIDTTNELSIDEPSRER
ncbi:hypothetical protein DY000_02021921 [Brassica cretica]|uniref:Uncharacterized protein n=1 Tax=Brassica cretica TaxID=69181 RepID=A0ABQ7EIH9_BRACR|nr:hypothetical protein DY000_02021921 [Brassica cretica]